MAVAAALAVGLWLSPSAHAAGGHERAAPDGDGPVTAPIIGGGSTCPAPAAVWTELETLVPPQRLADDIRALSAEAGPPTILDQGAAYRVVVAGRAREYRDEPRDCAHRARVAAIFMALSLEPAEPTGDEAAPVVPTPPPVPAPVVTQPPPDVRARLDVGARFDAGLGPSPPDLTGGLAVRLGLGRGPLLLAAGAAFLLPRDVTIGDLRLRQWRIPVDVALRARRSGGTFPPYGEVGVVVALISERARELATSNAAHAFELGLRAAVGVHGTSPRLTPFAALHAELIPIPPSIVALPRGAVGHTPYLWLGATAGLSWGVP